MVRGVRGCHIDFFLIHTTIYSHLCGLRKTHATFWLTLSSELTASTKPTLTRENTWFGAIGTSSFSWFYFRYRNYKIMGSLQTFLTFHSFALLACAILSVPIVWPVCYRVKAHSLLAFVLVQLVELPSSGWGRAGALLPACPLSWCCAPGQGACRSPGICHHVAERASKEDVREQPVPHHPAK